MNDHVTLVCLRNGTHKRKTHDNTQTRAGETFETEGVADGHAAKNKPVRDVI